jgi:hypothetical protein
MESIRDYSIRLAAALKGCHADLRRVNASPQMALHEQLKILRLNERLLDRLGTKLAMLLAEQPDAHPDPENAGPEDLRDLEQMLRKVRQLISLRNRELTKLN